MASLVDRLLAHDGVRTLRSGFLRSCRGFADRPAVAIREESITYRQLFSLAARVGATLQRAQEGAPPEPGPPLTAVFGHRSFAAFAGILGALLRGHGYVPLNPLYPIDRSRAMLARSECRALVVSSDALGQLDDLLAGVDRPLVVVAPDTDDLNASRSRCPQHRFLGARDLAEGEALRPAAVDRDGIAYLLFTSGSTGQPKGVMVAHRNVTAFLDAMVSRYEVSERDRLSQTFDLTFDLSLFDMFVAWERGACLCCPTQKEKLFPAKYLKTQALSIWFSVPSTAVMMNKLRVLKPGTLPSLRHSLFCGEGLPVEIAQAWQGAAPQSTVENLYGPTELTVACTLYRWQGEASLPHCQLGLVPIGAPYPGMKVLVADEALVEVAPAETGELLMTGPQLSLGYWRDPERTAQAFVRPPGRDEVYYRTGDRVRRPAGDGPLVYLGRVDNQIKVQGYRVELGEVESVVRSTGGVDLAVAVGFPRVPTGADGIVVFVSHPAANTDEIRERVKAALPSYMHPGRVVNLPELPLNANGKVDRGALLAALEDGRL